MTLKAYRDAIVAAIETANLGFREVAAHGGTFTEKQLQRYALKAPACRVAFLGIEKAGKLSTGEISGPVKMAAYVIAEDRKGAESFDVALDLAESLAGAIEGKTFGVAGAGMAQVTGIQNLFTLEADKRGCTIAAVTFTADVRIGVNSYAVDEAALPPGGLSITELQMLGIEVPGDTASFTPGD